MAIERLAPDALLLQTNLTGTLSAVTDDPDSPDATFLTSPTLQTAAAQTLYFQDTQAGEGYGMDTVAPATANFHNSTAASGWQTGSNTPRFEYLDYNTQVGRSSLDTTEPAAQIITTAGSGNFFRSPTPYTGSFAAGNWSLQMGVRGTTALDFNLRWHVFASQDPTGADGTERQLNSSPIASTTQTAALTTTLTNIPATWAAPAITLNNEYLFFALYLNLVTSTGGGNTQAMYLVKSSTSRVLTSAFTASEPNTRARVSFPNPVERPTLGSGLQEFRALVRLRGAGSPTATLSLYENGSPISTLAGPTAVTSAAGQIISGTFDATGRDPASIEADVLGNGIVGGSVAVGAIEWNADTTPYVISGGFIPSRQALYGGTLEAPVVNTDVAVSFPTPPDTLIAGAGLQEFRVLARKQGGGADPSVTIYLYENGSQVGSALLGPTTISDPTGVVLAATWNASSLASGLTGINVECRVVGTGTAGAAVEIGAIEWNAFGFTSQIVSGFIPSRATLFEGGALRADPITLSGGFIPSRQALYGGDVLSGVIQGGFIGGQMRADAKLMAFRQPPPKNRAVIYGGSLTESAATSNRRTLAPDQILATTNLSSNVNDVRDDPDAPDEVFLGVT